MPDLNFDNIINNLEQFTESESNYSTPEISPDLIAQDTGKKSPNRFFLNYSVHNYKPIKFWDINLTFTEVTHKNSPLTRARLIVDSASGNAFLELNTRQLNQKDGKERKLYRIKPEYIETITALFRREHKPINHIQPFQRLNKTLDWEKGTKEYYNKSPTDVTAHYAGLSLQVIKDIERLLANNELNPLLLINLGAGAGKTEALMALWGYRIAPVSEEQFKTITSTRNVQLSQDKIYIYFDEHHQLHYSIVDYKHNLYTGVLEKNALEQDRHLLEILKNIRDNDLQLKLQELVSLIQDQHPQAQFLGKNSLYHYPDFYTHSSDLSEASIKEARENNRVAQTLFASQQLFEPLDMQLIDTILPTLLEKIKSTRPDCSPELHVTFFGSTTTLVLPNMAIAAITYKKLAAFLDERSTVHLNGLGEVMMTSRLLKKAGFIILESEKNRLKLAKRGAAEIEQEKFNKLQRSNKLDLYLCPNPLYFLDLCSQREQSNAFTKALDDISRSPGNVLTIDLSFSEITPQLLARLSALYDAYPGVNIHLQMVDHRIEQLNLLRQFYIEKCIKNPKHSINTMQHISDIDFIGSIARNQWLNQQGTEGRNHNAAALVDEITTIMKMAQNMDLTSEKASLINEYCLNKFQAFLIDLNNVKAVYHVMFHKLRYSSLLNVLFTPNIPDNVFFDLINDLIKQNSIYMNSNLIGLYLTSQEAYRALYAQRIKQVFDQQNLEVLIKLASSKETISLFSDFVPHDYVKGELLAIALVHLVGLLKEEKDSDLLNTIIRLVQTKTYLVAVFTYLMMTSEDHITLKDVHAQLIAYQPPPEIIETLPNGRRGDKMGGHTLSSYTITDNANKTYIIKEQDANLQKDGHHLLFPLLTLKSMTYGMVMTPSNGVIVPPGNDPVLEVLALSLFRELGIPVANTQLGIVNKEDDTLYAVISEKEPEGTVTLAEFLKQKTSTSLLTDQALQVLVPQLLQLTIYCTLFLGDADLTLENILIEPKTLTLKRIDPWCFMAGTLDEDPFSQLMTLVKDNNSIQHGTAKHLLSMIFLEGQTKNLSIIDEYKPFLDFVENNASNLDVYITTCMEALANKLNDSDYIYNKIDQLAPFMRSSMVDTLKEFVHTRILQLQSIHSDKATFSYT